MSQIPFTGRVKPRWSVSAHGPTPPSTAMVPQRIACVSVGPPLSAIASGVNVVLRQSRPSVGIVSLVGVADKKHAVEAGNVGPSPVGATCWVPPPSRLPPSVVMYQSQLPPSTLPP